MTLSQIKTEDGTDEEPPRPPQQSPEQRAESKNNDANELYKSRNFDEALALYNQIILECPHVAKFYGNRCACLIMMNKYKEALRDATKCLELDPNSIKACKFIIKSSLKVGDINETESALLTLEKLNSLEKKSVDKELKDLAELKEFYLLSQRALSQNKHSEVVKCIHHCCQISPYSVGYKIIKAQSLALLERFGESVICINEALNIEERNVDALYIRATSSYYNDKFDQAIQDFELVMQISFDGQYEDASTLWGLAKELQSKRLEGKAAFDAKNYEKADKIYAEALSVDSNNHKTNAKLHCFRGLIAAKLEKYKDSIRACTKALNIDPNLSKALYRRAQSYMELEEFELAIYDYKRVCKLEINNENSREYRRLLSEAEAAYSAYQIKGHTKNFYDILGVKKDASVNDIKKAYLREAEMYHPDNHRNTSAEEKKILSKKFQQIGEAYETLKDPIKRSDHDNKENKQESQDEEQGTYYDILGVSSYASPYEIQLAYNTKVNIYLPNHRAYEPDPKNKEQVKKFQDLNKAYCVLINPKQRINYDQFLKICQLSGFQGSYDKNITYSVSEPPWRKKHYGLLLIGVSPAIFFVIYQIILYILVWGKFIFAPIYSGYKNFPTFVKIIKTIRP